MKFPKSGANISVKAFFTYLFEECDLTSLLVSLSIRTEIQNRLILSNEWRMKRKIKEMVRDEILKKTN